MKRVTEEEKDKIMLRFKDGVDLPYFVAQTFSDEEWEAFRQMHGAYNYAYLQGSSTPRRW
jgi:hypothetical protein